MSNDIANSKRPSHLAYSVRNFQKNGQQESNWTRIGVAWLHRDGEGFDIALEALPVNGRIALRVNKPRSEQA